jgi:hypothetical protein
MVLLVHSIKPFYLGGEGTYVASWGDALWVTFLNSAIRCCVPLFVMTSSYLLLPVKGEGMAFIRRRFVRVGLPFAVWTLLYAFIPYWGTEDMSISENLSRLVFNFMPHAGHLWFVYMILGLYLIMPIISPWLERVSQRGERMFIMVWLLSTAVGLLVTNIVYSHSVLDAVPDKKMGKTTMAHLMGGKKGQIALSAFINTAPYLIVVVGVVLGLLHWAYLAVLLVMPVSIWLVGSLRDFVNHKETSLEPKRWMGPMGDFERFRQAGLDWFMLRWLTARNIVTMFCFVIIVVNFIV